MPPFDAQLKFSEPVKIGWLSVMISVLAAADRQGVIAETVKLAEDGDEWVVRLYECWNRRGQTAVTFPFPVEKAVDCGILEEGTDPLKVQGNQVLCPMRPYEIKTIRVKPVFPVS